MSHYTHLTIADREKAMVMKEKGASQRTIAAAIGCDHSAISREFARNTGKSGYSANEAQHLYEKRRKQCGVKPILANPEVADYVKERLELQWSPEEIAGRAKKDGYPISFSYNSIYRAVANRILPISLHKQMRIKSKHRSPKTDDKRGKVLDCLTIHDRPRSVEKRKTIGHWESDSVLGQRKTGSIGTHVERKTGYLIAFKLEDRKGDAYTLATEKAFESLPARCKKSFTVDRGTEFYQHKLLSEKTGMKVFFCDPYCAWQRGSVENTNGLLRQYFPKGSSFSGISQQSLQLVVDRINNRPRKRFGYLTPTELFARWCC
jgi:IS30 family transposase